MPMSHFKTGFGDLPELSNTISNKSPSDSASKSNPLLWILPLLLLLVALCPALVAVLFSAHWLSSLPIEKSSLLSSLLRAGDLAGGPMKQGFGVLCEFAGAYLKTLCPKLTRTVVSIFDAKVG